MSFQQIVLIIAGVLLVVFLIMIAFSISGVRSKLVYPPEQAECPDYWKVVGVNKCENVKGLGNGTCSNVMDFNGAQYQGASGLKEKQKWAQQCGLVWDGVTNYVIPANSNSS